MQNNYLGHHHMQTKLPDNIGQNYGNLYPYNTTKTTNVKTQRPITKQLATTCTTNTHPKKSRTVFTKKQINELEGVFYQKRYLTIKDREELSRRLTLTENQVKVWFQNRRNKWKREMNFKVEFAKFNMVSNPMNIARGVDGNSPNNLMLPTTTTTSPSETSDFQLTSHRYVYRNAFQDSYLNPYPNVFSMQDAQQNFSPLSNSSSTNELSYQENNNSVPQASVSLETYDNNSIVYPPPPPTAAQSMTDYQHQQHTQHQAIYSNYNYDAYDATRYQQGVEQQALPYDAHNYSPIHQTNSYAEEATHPQTTDTPTKYTDENQQQTSPYQAYKYTEPSADQQTITYTPQIPPIVSTTPGRGMYTDNTGVVYTTLTECRNSSENQALNLPNQQFGYGSHY